MALRGARHLLLAHRNDEHPEQLRRLCHARSSRGDTFHGTIFGRWKLSEIQKPLINAMPFAKGVITALQPRACRLAR